MINKLIKKIFLVASCLQSAGLLNCVNTVVTNPTKPENQQLKIMFLSDKWTKNRDEWDEKIILTTESELDSVLSKHIPESEVDGLNFFNWSREMVLQNKNLYSKADSSVDKYIFFWPVWTPSDLYMATNIIENYPIEEYFMSNVSNSEKKLLHIYNDEIQIKYQNSIDAETMKNSLSVFQNWMKLIIPKTKTNFVYSSLAVPKSTINFRISLTIREKILTERIYSDMGYATSSSLIFNGNFSFDMNSEIIRFLVKSIGVSNDLMNLEFKYDDTKINQFYLNLPSRVSEVRGLTIFSDIEDDSFKLQLKTFDQILIKNAYNEIAKYYLN